MEITLRVWCMLAFLVCFPKFAALAPAQQDEPLPTLNLLEELGAFVPASPGGDSGNQLELTGQYSVVRDGQSGQLRITATMQPGWHVYSLTQQAGGPQKSELVVRTEDVTVTGPFIPDPPPHVKHYEFWPGLAVEEHAEKVTWTAPIRVSEGVAAENVEIEVSFEGQVCQDSGVCIPVPARSVPISFAGFMEPVSPTGEYRAESVHATIRGFIAPAGGTAQLVLEAIPDPDWHIYAYEATDPKQLSKPTLIVLNLPPGWTSSAPVASSEPHREETGLGPEFPEHLYYHETDVRWTTELQIPPGAEPGEYTVSGWIGYQTCSTQCDLPVAAEFSASLHVAEAPAGGTIALAFRPAAYDDVARRALAVAERSPPNPSDTAEATTGLDLDRLEVAESDKSLGLVLVLAFCGGFILNFMPCVLPVIGLKIMAFIQQSGDSRARVFAMNLWYCAGLISVFLVLATVAVFAGVGWGAQFSSATFNIVLASVVFAFALSFLGVWEIPIPGFVGSSAMGDLAVREGPSGAFFKGVLTTVLATPCTGPLLIPALTWAVGQPPLVAYAGYAAVGLGMASPYLVIGAFPGLVSFLPKPGAWMETFKQFMGFILLGTVVYLLTLVSVTLVVPTLAFMIGIWAALWWIGRTPITAGSQVKLRAWLGGAALAAGIGLIAFLWLDDIMYRRFLSDVDRVLAERNSAEAVSTAGDHENELPWQPFSLARLQQLTQEGKTVLIDFTADWCVNCYFNEQAALNQKETREFVDQNGIVTLVADKSDPNPEADELLRKLGNSVAAIPFVAIFPAENPNRPILLDGLLTSPKPVIEALERAGPSRGVATLSTEDGTMAAIQNP